MATDHGVREIGAKEEEFIKNERKLLPPLRTGLLQLKSCEEGIAALPPFVVDQLAHHGTELKLSLSNQMIILVRNGTPSISFAALIN